MTRDPWLCNTCKRTITQTPPHMNGPEHDQELHAASKRSADRWIYGGLALAALGLVLQVIGLLGKALGWWT